MNTTIHHLNNQVVVSKLNAFFKKYNLPSLAHRCGMRKARGVQIAEMLLALLAMPFLGCNMYQYFTEKNKPFQRDVLYSFVNNPRLSWRLFLQKIALSAQRFMCALSKKTSQGYLIVDDSLLERPRSKKVELCSRVYNHSEKTFSYGFRCLTLGWSDSNSFLPLDFALLCSKKIKHILLDVVKICNPCVCGARRRKEAKFTAPDVLIQMLARAKNAGIKAKYLLMDSWFGTPSIISDAAQYFPVICRVKNSSKIHYLTKSGGALPIEKIYRTLRKRPGKAKWLASVCVMLKTDREVRLVFVRNRNKKHEWIALLCTDTALPEAEVARIYGIRWDIEVFFRTIKQHLFFGKGCQARDFDAIIAHSTLAMIRYIFLSLEQRQLKDSCTLGVLFRACAKELDEISSMEALIRIFGIAVEKLQSQNIPAEILSAIFDTLIASALEFFGLSASEKRSLAAQAA